MKRRQLLAMLAAAACPVAAQAQSPRLPVIGYLTRRSEKNDQPFAAAFRRGLEEGGQLAGGTVAIEYRRAEEADAFSLLLSELVARKVDLIFASGSNAAAAAKAATGTIPIVFAGASDPVAIGLVEQLNRPGGNVTGVTVISHRLGAKRLELLRQVVPAVTTVVLLINPENPSAASDLKETQQAAMAMGLRIAVAEATTEGGFRPAFELMTRERAGAIVIAGDPLFTSHREGLAEMAALRQAPSIYVLREYAAAGGLMSYGGSFEDAHRLCGAYAARILRGARPAELPVVMSAKFDLVVNLRTAKALGLVIPPDILAGADELIE